MQTFITKLPIVHKLMQWVDKFSLCQSFLRGINPKIAVKNVPCRINMFCIPMCKRSYMHIDYNYNCIDYNNCVFEYYNFFTNYNNYPYNNYNSTSR